MVAHLDSQFRTQRSCAVLVTSSFLPGHGGIETYLAELCDDLAPRLAVLAPGSRGGTPIPADLGYPTIGYPGSMLWPGGGVVRAIQDACERHDTDRVLFGTPWPLILTAPRLRKAGLRYASIVHGSELFVPAAIPLLRAKVARALEEADALFPVSEFTGRKISTFLSKSKRRVPSVHVLHARIDTDRFTPKVATGPIKERLGIHDDDRVILCFGRLVKRKGVDRMIAAMPEITRAVPRATLIVGGTGPELKRLQRRAHRTQGRVMFAGRVPDEDAPALYALADVFAFPVFDRYFGLDTEGLGVVLLEAAACGTACITGRSGGTPEAVIDGDSGYVIHARDKHQLVGRVVSILMDPHEAQRMGAIGRAHVERSFSKKNSPDALLKWIGST
ncbi:MAG: phosphatidyl-myo-inositol dimannoside synthase [Actinomycetota bacterium]|nr:phosphatidyl-myo-inositol dimannoside synthase [Actinomycetota bacterium]